VGVAKQYCGVLGKQENCQVAVAVSLAHPVLSVPAAYRLYLPEAWAQDRRRRAAAGIPAAVAFAPKWQLALAALDDLLGVAPVRWTVDGLGIKPPLTASVHTLSAIAGRARSAADAGCTSPR